MSSNQRVIMIHWNFLEPTTYFNFCDVWYIKVNFGSIFTIKSLVTTMIRYQCVIIHIPLETMNALHDTHRSLRPRISND